MDFIKILEEESSHPSAPRPKPKSVAYAFSAAIGGLTAIVTLASFPFIVPYLRRACLPYLPATTTQVKNVLEALKGRSGKLVDLGSGDGRIVVAAAKNGFCSTGVEINPWLVMYSKLSSLFSGVQEKTIFYKKDLWKFDLKPYNNVVIFGVESMMNELEKKFQKELADGAHILACRFPLPNLEPVKTVGSGIDKVWVYIIGKS